MLFYSKTTESEGIDISEGVDIVCTGVESSKWCDICHFYFFKNRNFNYQPHVCNECHGAALSAQPITDLKIIVIKSNTTKILVCLKQVA